MSSYAEFEVPVIGVHLKICANGDKSLWKKRQRKSSFTCKKVFKILKLHKFCFIKDNYLKFLAFVYFLPKKILAKFQSNKTNLKTSIKFLVGKFNFFLTHLV